MNFRTVKRLAGYLKIVLCTIFLLGWAIQGEAAWFKPHSDIGLSQHSKFEPGHTARPAGQESAGARRSESKPDPSALPTAAHTPAGQGGNHSLFTDPADVLAGYRITERPAIRAPPATSPFE